MLTLLLPGTILVTTIVLLYHLSFVSRHYLVTRRHGCRSATRLPQSIWRFGTDIQTMMIQIIRPGHQTRSMQSLFGTYGRTFQAMIWGQPWIWTCEVDNIKAVNILHFVDFGVEALRKPTDSGWMGDGIFVSDGRRWKDSRWLFKPLFATSGLVADLTGFELDVGRLFNVLPTNGETVDLAIIFRRFYFDVSFSYSFGSSPGALQPHGASIVDVDRFHSAFETATVGMGRRMALGRAFRWADSQERQWADACAYVHDVFDTYIDAAVVRYQESETTGVTVPEDEKEHHLSPAPRSPSMLSKLVQFTQDKTFLRDQLLNVFLGAKDTASIGIADVFFHLARYPDI